MLRSLRLRLSLLYLLASLGLVALLGGATYGLLTLYFQQSTDLAMEYKMAIEFQLRGQPLPDSLAAAEQEWFQENDRSSSIKPAQISATNDLVLEPTHTTAATQTKKINILLTPDNKETNEPGTSPTITVEADDDYDEADGIESDEHTSSDIENTPSGTDFSSREPDERDELYDGDLAAVFVLPGSNPSQPDIALNPSLPLVDNPAAINQAKSTGSDLRTIQMDDGSRLRLLTYLAPDGNILQVGRLLNDQDRLLSQYLSGLFLMGGAASLLLALASWFMAGRSIRPAERAWEQQRSFVANASHELRTPLTLLRASADYALRNPKQKEREKSLRDIIGEVDYMNRLVEELLLLSRLDARHLKMELEKVSIPELLDEINRQVGKVTGDKGITLQTSAMPGFVIGDPLRLRQALLILLDNAMRFTPRGGTIRLEAARSSKDVIFSVSDNGCGIPEEDLPHLFERFYTVQGQPDSGRSNGLGLSIAKGLVETHHGRISVSSKPEQGTTVRISLPLV